ncbi:thiamine pyrophosphate-dependent enzyme [Desulfoscipio geothermicus]|uniref:2-oxoglutarate ferredoxin oxidoreductase subunit beta n=1 Tax=Desulfoscipio geothermicus DSM 3669 TaxID=1121426 RepID=A0A1I6DAM4_9FIRM|nr:thiamine pyrophosphate-dependent enzyme [Desulfoscipio geothermicus]SFR02510.1 2-oxoglutarate ferredoxin oxidoreductase subunit beta [Desulfoscipio geothermicus DSM 3669]
MKKVFTRPKALADIPFHYCPGCTHGIVHRLVAEVIDEMGMYERALGVAPVGCSVFIYNYLDIDMYQAAHGRAPAVGTGIKRVLPDRLVFTYQGDGDAAAIGTGELVHAAARGEKITVIFINNAVYAMTGGQMAPTTLLGQKTTTTPFGREGEINGLPVKVCEMLAPLDGSAYLARVSVHNPKNVNAAKKAIRKAFEVQMRGDGFTMVEVLSSCPTNWGLSPLEALKWLEEKMIPYYPLGEYKTPAEVNG